MIRLLLCALFLHGALGEVDVCHTPVDDPTAEEYCFGKYCTPEQDVCNTETKECECKTGFGQEWFECAEKGTDDFASILSDPEAFTVNKRQGGRMPVPCGYMFSRAKVEAENVPGATCDVQLYVHHKRVNGQQFVAGFELHVITEGFADDRYNKHYVYKGDGEKNGPEYCYNYYVSTNGGQSYYNKVHDKAWKKVNRKDYVFGPQEKSNRLVLQIDTCQVKVTFRPADEALGVSKQEYVPGIAIKYDKNDLIEYQSQTDVVSLPPDQPKIAKSRDVGNVLTHQAFTQNQVYDYTNYPGHSDQCDNVKNSLKACSSNAEVDKATQKCKFILGRPLFVKCYSLAKEDAANKDHGVSKVLELYSACVDSFCAPNKVQGCNRMNNLLNSLPAGSKCPEELPPTADFNDFPCTIDAAQPPVPA